MTDEHAIQMLNLLISSPRFGGVEFDYALLEIAALNLLAANNLEPRIGQPLPLADALQDTEFDDDEITSGEDTGEGARRFGRVIVHWDAQNFRATDVHANIPEAIHAFESIREYHEGNDEEEE